MDDLHAPTVPSGPSTQASTNGVEKPQSLQELISLKENLEAELSALGSVLDSVIAHIFLLRNELLWLMKSSMASI